MSLTVQDLIQDALEELVAVPAGDTPSAADLAKGLSALKRMVDASNINRGNIAVLRRDTRTLVAGTQSYTIGVDPAGVLTPTFAAVRPIRIQRANILLTSGTSTIYEPLRLITVDQWAAKSYRATSGLPKDLYNDYAVPLSTWYFDPIPDAAYVMETFTWQQFVQAAQADVLAIPPGYYEYWVYGLAIRLAAVYGKEPRQTTVGLFGEARAAVMALNAPSPRMRSDADYDSEPARVSYGWLDAYQGSRP